MKIQKALNERSRGVKDVEGLKRRLFESATVAEGEQPFENPEELLQKLTLYFAGQEQLIVQINLTNLQVNLENGMTLMEGIIRRDMKAQEAKALIEIIDNIKRGVRRNYETDAKRVAMLDVAKLQRMADTAAAESRALHDEIQLLNGQIDLLPKAE